MSKVSKAIPMKIEMAREKIIEELPIETYLLDKKLVSSILSINGKMFCPIHDDTNPSCFYNTEKNVYNCFACGSKGTVVEMDYGIHKKEDDTENIVRTILRLSREYNIEIPDMFAYEGSNAPKRVKIKKQKLGSRTLTPENEEKVYARKLAAFETKLRNKVVTPENGMKEIPWENRLVIYNAIDKSLLKEVSSKETFEKVTKYLENVIKEL